MDTRPPYQDISSLNEVPFYSHSYKVNPHAHYRDLLSRPPFWALAEGRPVVVAAKFKDVEAIYRDWETFSSVKPPEPGMEKFDFFNGFQDLVHTDPPDHTRLRSVIKSAFFPDAIARLEPAVQVLVDELLAAVIAGPEEFDLMEKFARPLSSRTMLGVLLNMKQEDFPVFINLAYTMSLLSDIPPGGSKPQAYLDAWSTGRDYCLRIIEEKRKAPTDDLVGTVVKAHAAGQLSADELFVMLIGLFIGGISTVASQVGNAVFQIVSRPDQYQQLVADPTLAANAFEEVMRYDSAGLFNYKFTTRDCVFEGLEIPAGTTVYILQHAAGFDPAMYENPFDFDVGRKVRRHLGFGFGVHFCIGAPVARLVGKVVLASLARQMPNVRLASDDPVSYGGWLQERALETLPLKIR